ncbi:MAG: hypothetical protein KIT84_04415 [Labilithrix sp.]|nr:hypothetical protein [Labilithrix sp.]MCW5810230.1 hypothetical protein [Labilithrix sp.]
MTLRSELVAVVDGLLADTKPGAAIELDALGDAIGARSVSADEIDAMLRLIEARGHRVETRPGGGGEAALKEVLAAARVLRAELGRAPRASEIAARAGLAEIDVRHALALARIMQR